METVYAIAHGILLIGGAIGVILLVILFCILISLMLSMKAWMVDVRNKYDMAQQFLLQPIRLISKLFEEPQGQ